MSDYLSETDDVRGDQGRVIRYQERDRARDFLRRSDVEHLIAVSNLLFYGAADIVKLSCAALAAP